MYMYVFTLLRKLNLVIHGITYVLTCNYLHNIITYILHKGYRLVQCYFGMVGIYVVCYIIGKVT